MESCEVHFIDCMGYWDLISELASLTLIGFIVFKTAKNCLNLNKAKENQFNQQVKKSLIRKLIVNLLSLTYEIFLVASIVLSVVIFLVHHQDIRESRQNKVNLWYKWSEIIFINVLNILNLTVGFIYWKAVRAFFKISQKQLPIIFQTFSKIVFIIVYFVNFVIIFVSLALLLNTEETHYQKYQMKVINVVNAVGVSCSTFICLACRLLYQKHILNSLSLNKIAIRKEKIYSLLIAFSTGCRLACVFVNLMGIDYTQGLRNYGQNCIDDTPYHALVMFLTTVCINMIPPFIFNLIFSCSQTQTKIYSEISEYLCKNDTESVRYV